jgi:hypothetical protein
MGKLTPLLLVAALGPSRLLAAAHAEGFAPVIEYVERLARSDGGYGWEDEPTSHLTPTWAAVGIYRLLGATPPHPVAVAEFVRARGFGRGQGRGVEQETRIWAVARNPRDSRMT